MSSQQETLLIDCGLPPQLIAALLQEWPCADRNEILKGIVDFACSCNALQEQTASLALAAKAERDRLAEVVDDLKRRPTVNLADYEKVCVERDTTLVQVDSLNSNLSCRLVEIRQLKQRVADLEVRVQDQDDLVEELRRTRGALNAIVDRANRGDGNDATQNSQHADSLRRKLEEAQTDRTRQLTQIGDLNEQILQIRRETDAARLELEKRDRAISVLKQQLINSITGYSTWQQNSVRTFPKRKRTGSNDVEMIRCSTATQTTFRVFNSSEAEKIRRKLTDGLRYRDGEIRKLVEEKRSLERWMLGTLTELEEQTSQCLVFVLGPPEESITGLSNLLGLISSCKGELNPLQRSSITSRTVLSKSTVAQRNFGGSEMPNFRTSSERSIDSFYSIDSGHRNNTANALDNTFMNLN